MRACSSLRQNVSTCSHCAPVKSSTWPLVGHELRLGSKALFSLDSFHSQEHFLQYANKLKRNIPVVHRTVFYLMLSRDGIRFSKVARRDLTSSLTSVHGQQSNPKENMVPFSPHSLLEKELTFTTRPRDIDLSLLGRPTAQAGPLK